LLLTGGKRYEGSRFCIPCDPSGSGGGKGLLFLGKGHALPKELEGGGENNG